MRAVLCNFYWIKRARQPLHNQPAGERASKKLTLQAYGIEDVEPPALPLVPVVRVPISNTDSDIEVLGTRNEFQLPHLRQGCTQFKFDPSSTGDQHYSSALYSKSTFECKILRSVRLLRVRLSCQQMLGCQFNGNSCVQPLARWGQEQ